MGYNNVFEFGGINSWTGEIVKELDTGAQTESQIRTQAKWMRQMTSEDRKEETMLLDELPQGAAPSRSDSYVKSRSHAMLIWQMITSEACKGDRSVQR